MEFDLEKNPFGVEVGDVVVTSAFTGVYRVEDIKFNAEKGYDDAKLIQVYTLEGKPVKLLRPAYSDVKLCKPAYLLAKQILERVKDFQGLYDFLEQCRKQKGI